MTKVPFLVCLLLCWCWCWLGALEGVVARNPRNFHIGAVLNDDDHVKNFFEIIDDLNNDPGVLPADVKIHGHVMLRQADAIEDVRSVCTQLMPNEISSMLIDDRVPSEAIAFTSSLHNIPIIGLTNRESIFSDKSLYNSYLRTASTYSHQADVWMEMITYLKYECVHFLASDSINGRNIKTRFLSLAHRYNLDIETIIEYSLRKPNITPELEEIKARNSSCRTFVLYVEADNAYDIFNQIAALNMSGADSVWLVSEQALDVANLPIGALGVRYKDWANIKSHIYDAVSVIAGAIRGMYQQVNFTQPPTDCHNIGRAKWIEGDIFYDYIREQTIIYGKTGKITFDERGDRMFAEYDIVNKQYDKKDKLHRMATALVVVGGYYYHRVEMKMKLDIQQDLILWPGNTTIKPIGYSMPNHLQIVTIAETPFVWVKEPNKEGNCHYDQIPCPLKKMDPATGQYFDALHCCEGYCIDLLKALALQLNFTYSLYQVPDGQYGGIQYNPANHRNEWSGVLGELIYGRADMAIGPLTITPERQVAIDFTKPFKYQGMTIVQKRQYRNRLRHPLTSFLQPFQNSLWVSVFVAVHVVALALYLLDRFSPFGRYKLPNCDSITEEDALNLSSAIWFTWGVLFNSGIGEGTPRSFSGRVLGVIWCGFAMIVVASYTANLAAFLVLDRPETALTGINDPRLRGTDGFNYSTIKDSAVELYFRRQAELAPMYKRMKEVRFFNNTEDAIAAVKTGRLNAFIWDSARLEYEAAKDCELSISGELFGRSGYAIGLPKGRPYWKDKVTMALLGMHEVGYMEDLDNKWILIPEEICQSKKTENFPPTLGLKNMLGVFFLVLAGIVGGIGLITFEMLYKRQQNNKQRRMELARNAVDKWKEVVENRKHLIESLNNAARQRYKSARSRKGQGMGNNSRTLSEDKSVSLSSTESIRRNCVNPANNNNNNDNLQALQKPHHLDLRVTNSPAKTSLVKLGSSSNNNNNNNNNKFGSDESSTSQSQTLSSFRRKVEQHPCANTRIHQRKPRLCREYSMNDDHEYQQQHCSSGGPQFSIEMNELPASHRPHSFELLPPPPPPPPPVVMSQHYLDHDILPPIPPPPLLTKRSPNVTKSGANYFNLT